MDIVPVVHMVDYASQPDLQIRCDQSWTTPAWDGFKPGGVKKWGLPEGVYKTDDGRNYTFEEDKITCPKCKKAPPEPPMAA